METNAKGPNDLIYNRSRLDEQLIKESKKGNVKLFDFGGTACTRSEHYPYGKLLFHVLDPDLAVDVRQTLQKLNNLCIFMAEHAVNLSEEKGLWLPAVADETLGDTQVNVTVSESWTTRTRKAHTIRRTMRNIEGSKAWKALHFFSDQYDSFRTVARSGQNYRITIRGSERNPDHEDPRYKGREMLCMNDFAIALGETLRINTPANRFRPKRADAWRGVADPLFRYHTQNEIEWLVYPPKESEQEPNQSD